MEQTDNPSELPGSLCCYSPSTTNTTTHGPFDSIYSTSQLTCHLPGWSPQPSVQPEFPDFVWFNSYFTEDLARDWPQLIPDPCSSSTSYPSPPSSNSPSKRKVPLPCETCSSIANFGVWGQGVLDSPPVALRPQFLPMSPPATLPTNTLSLPDANSELGFDSVRHEGDDQQRLSPKRRRRVAPPDPDGTILYGEGPEPGSTFSSASSSETCYEVHDQLLSPISPEWPSNRIDEGSPLGEGQEDCALLIEGSLPADRKKSRRSKKDRSRSSSGDEPLAPLSCAGGPAFCISPPASPETALNSVDSSLPPTSTNPGDSLTTSPLSYYSQLPTPPTVLNPLLSPERFPPSLLQKPSLFVDTNVAYSPGDSTISDDGLFLPPFGTSRSPGWLSSPELDESSPPLWPGPLENSPFLPPGPIGEDEQYLDDPRPAFHPPNQRQPEILEDLDFDAEDAEVPAAPSSPSVLRWSVSLPEDESDPHSPTLPTLISFSGSDVDPELLDFSAADDDAPPESSFGSSATSFLSFAPGSISPRAESLLLINDSTDVSTPRSPSPESLPELDSLGAAAESDDPVLKKLYEMRGRSIAAEKIARHRELQLLEEGKVHERTEVRKERKREKERSKEIGALLRLKLGDADDSDASDESGSPAMTKLPPTSPKGKDHHKGPKKAISNMAQLVAKMMLRRHETARSLSRRSLNCGGYGSEFGIVRGKTKKDLTRSPLSNAVAVLDPVEEKDSGAIFVDSALGPTGAML